MTADSSRSRGKRNAARVPEEAASREERYLVAECSPQTGTPHVIVTLASPDRRPALYRLALDASSISCRAIVVNLVHKGFSDALRRVGQ